MPLLEKPSTPIKAEEEAKVAAWQNEVDTLEQKQMQIQADQMSLLFSQIHILTRELGDLQKQFVTFGQDTTQSLDSLRCDLTASQEEAHAALRLELAEHGNNAAEMKAAWEEAHNALSDAMDTGLSNMAADHAKALEEHKSENARALAEHGENMANHGNNLSDLEDLHNQRYEEHQANLQAGLADVHGNLQKELAELKSGHAVNLQSIVTDLTAQVDKLTLDMEQMATDIGAAQEEAHSALRLELAEHGNNAAEMKAAWEEAHNALAKSMDENLSTLASDQAKALEAQATAQSQALSDHADTHGGNLSALEDLHNKRYEEHSASLQNGLQDVHSTLQQELADLRSGHAVNLKQVVTDITAQVDKLTVDVQQMATDLTAAQEEAHSALRLELAEHGNSASEMKAAWEEAHKALAASMDDNLSNLAEQHAKALEEHASNTSKQLEDHSSLHGGNLEDMEALHKQRYEQHANELQAGLEGVHNNLQKELAELKSGHAVNLQAIVTDLTSQVDKLTLDVEQMGKDVAASQEEAHAALRLELAEHGSNAAEMKAAWEEAHDALTKTMDENLATMASEHADQTDKHNQGHAQRMDEMEAQIAAQFDRLHSNHDALHDLHASGRLEHAAALEKGMEAVLENTHGRLQDELKELRSGHAANLKQVLEDVTVQVDTLTLAMENAQVVRRGNSEKLEQIFRGMEKAFNSVSFTGKKKATNGKAEEPKKEEPKKAPTFSSKPESAPAVTTKYGAAKAAPAVATPAPAPSRFSFGKK